MKTVTFNKNLGVSFGKKYIPKLYIRLLVEEFNKNKYIPILTAVKEKFNINKADFLKIIDVKNIIVSEFSGRYIIRFNNIIIENSKTLEQLIDFINDGDLSFNGYNLFNNVTSYINNNIYSIYRYYLMQGE